MGIYLNPKAEAFRINKLAKIYVDKSEIINNIEEVISTNDNFVCLSRPRRFGKSMAGNMIAAFYTKGDDTRADFEKMKVAETEGYDKNLNKFNVIKLDLGAMYQAADDKNNLIKEINETLKEEFEMQFPDDSFDKCSNLSKCILQAYAHTGEKFVMIIDEYDILVRERVPNALFEQYLSFLNSLFKNGVLRPAFALAYVTGILPIVRDKVQSKLNEFDEYTMLLPRTLGGNIGFTAEEVKALCAEHGMNYEEMARWYDGYKLDEISIFNPKSVVDAIRNKKYKSYWSYTGSFESIKDYVMMNIEGIKDDVIKMISGEEIHVEVDFFKNTLDNFECKDDIFTYLIHLGYLGYNENEETCFIPNEEVRKEWVKTLQTNADYKKIVEIINASKKLLDDTIQGDGEAVAKALDASHIAVTSNLTYNDEHCFQSAIYLAYFYANTRYTVIKELPTGKGYADIAFIPYVPNIPAMIVELKHNKSTGSAIQQIKDKVYDEVLKHYRGDLLFVGVNYDENTKQHTCEIEKLVM